jgi:phage anti-repressor protein
MSGLIVKNKSIDPIIQILQEELTFDQKELFIDQFYSYMNYDEEFDFVVDLDEIYEWMGFSRKDPAKRLLKKYFTLDKDYQDFAPPTGGAKDDNRGGHNKEKILMTISTLKMMGMLANTEKGRNFRKYFLAMERVFNKYLKKQLEEKDNLLAEKDNLLEELKKRENKTYQEMEKSGSIYILKTDGGIKVGRTKDKVSKRVKGLQTGNVNDIEILFEFKTSDAIMLEGIVHNILNRYRNAKMIENTSVQTIKNKSVHTIENTSIPIPEPEQVKVKTREYAQDNNEYETWFMENIVYQEEAILNLKDVSQKYYSSEKVHPRDSGKIKTEIKKFIKKKYPDVNCECKQIKFGIKYKRGWNSFTLL